MRVRQLVIVAEKLEPVVERLCRVFDLRVGFRDPGVAEFGLVNAVLPVGDTFLEVVSPKQPGTTAGRYLERRGGDGGYMVILQTGDLAADRARLERLGVRVVWQIRLDDIASMHLHPRDVGGALVSLDQPRPPESWRWGGPEWREHVSTAVVAQATGADLQSPDPGALAARWSEVLDRPLDLREGTPVLPLEGGEIRFVPDADGRGEGVSRFHLRATDRERALANAERIGAVTADGEIAIGGVRFAL